MIPMTELRPYNVLQYVCVCLLWHSCSSSLSCPAQNEQVDEMASVSLLQSRMEVHAFDASQVATNRTNWSAKQVEKRNADDKGPEETQKEVKTTGSTMKTPPLKVVDMRRFQAIGLCLVVACLVAYVLLRWFAPSLAYPFIYCVCYVVCSCCIISLNKFIMDDTVFPYAMALTMLHMTATWLGMFVLYCARPEMFPQMQLAIKGSEIIGVAYSLPQYFIPLGCFFGTSLFGANAAYHYCSVAFLQFMKETGLVWIFVLSVAIGTQEFTRAKVLVITWILTGACLAITGEINFAILGFFLQMISQTAEVSRHVCGEWMMAASTFKLDALTYTLSLAPMALIPLAIGTACTYEPAMITAFMKNAHILGLSCSIAVCLNVAISTVVKHCSALGFTLLAMFKDILIVCLSTIIFGDIVTLQQIIGFVVAVAGIGAFSTIKQKPEWWEWISPSGGKALVQK